jgi:hypothetical protein
VPECAFFSEKSVLSGHQVPKCSYFSLWTPKRAVSAENKRIEAPFAFMAPDFTELKRILALGRQRRPGGAIADGSSGSRQPRQAASGCSALPAGGRVRGANR